MACVLPDMPKYLPFLLCPSKCNEQLVRLKHDEVARKSKRIRFISKKDVFFHYLSIDFV